MNISFKRKYIQNYQSNLSLVRLFPCEGCTPFHGESWGVMGYPQVFCDLFFVFSCGDFRHVSTRIFHRHISTNSDNFFTMTKKLIYRQNSHPQNMPISDRFRQFDFSIEWTKFRQTLFFCASHYYYMPIIQKVFIFLTDKFRACSPFFFVTSQFYYNTKKFYFQPVYFKNFNHTL